MSQADDNRRKMPTVAAFVDEVRAVFGDCKVVYAKENGIELGRRPERGIIPNLSEYKPKRSTRK